jgi:hypothetical protein
MVDPGNQIEVVDFTRMLLQDLKRIQSDLPIKFEKFYAEAPSTDEPGATEEFCEDIFDSLDQMDGPVEVINDSTKQLNLTEGKAARTITLLEDQGINPADPPYD